MPLSDYDPIFKSAANEWNLDPTLLKAVAAQESGGNPNAVSGKNAQGLMQIIPETQKYLGITDPNDPVQSIYGAAKYLSEGLEKEGSPEGALLYYHGGPDWRDAYGAESKAYVPAVTARYKQFASAQPAAPAAAASDATPSHGAMSDDDFLKSTGGTPASPAGEDDAAFLARTGGKAPAPAAPNPDAGANEYGITDDPQQFNKPLTPAEQGVSNTANAVIHGAKDGFGSGPLGMSPQTDQALTNAGVFNGPNEYNPLKGINRAVIGGGASLGDLALRSGGALLGAYQHGIAQAGAEVGAPQLGRALAGIPEAFPTGDLGGGTLFPHASGVVMDRGTPRGQVITQFPVTAQSMLDNPLSATRPATANDVYANPLARTQSAIQNPAFVPPGTQVPTQVVQATRPDFIPPAPRPASPVEMPPVAAAPTGPQTQITRKGTTSPGTSVLNSNKTQSPTHAANDVNPLLPSPANDAEAYPAWNASQTQRPANDVATPAPSAQSAAPSQPTDSVTAPRLTVPAAEPAAPRSVGAAASRDMTAPENMPAETPEQKLTNLGKSVTQSAEDRAGPQSEDHTVYVPGVERPLAAREFSTQNSLDDKTLRATDPAYRADQEKIEKDNNQTMVDLLGKDAGDANALKTAHDERAEVAPPAQKLFANEQPVDASGVVKHIDDILAGPDGKRAAVVRTLNAVKQSLFDADGNLETLPSQLYGARKNITDLLKKGVGEGADDVRASKSILTGLLDKIDPIINKGASKYQTYLDQFHEASQPINQMEFLQKYQTGSRKLTNVDGYLQLSKVQKMLDDIYQGRSAKGINPAKSLTDEHIQNITNVRNELAAMSLKDRLAKVKGSDTTQQTNRAGFLGDGPLGAAVKGAAEMGAHALLFHTTGGIGNAAMAIHRAVINPAREAHKATKVENALVARKSQLLETKPSNPLQTH